MYKKTFRRLSQASENLHRDVVLGASDNHWTTKFLDERTRVCNLVPERLMLLYTPARDDVAAGITRVGHRYRVPANVDLGLAVR